MKRKILENTDIDWFEVVFRALFFGIKALSFAPRNMTLSLSVESLLRGTFAHIPAQGKLEILNNWLVAIDISGHIVHFDHAQSEKSVELIRFYDGLVIAIPPGSFILPTFTDLHLHAPQFLYQGTGLDLPLLEWLHRYAFKAEEKLDTDPELARKVYRRLADSLLKAGTGTVCLFGTLKAETNLVLAEEMEAAGVRAFVGKVSMDISSRPSYVEASASAAIDAARAFGEQIDGKFSSSRSRPPLVQPVITPRFVPTCSDELLHGLGVLSEQKGWRVQSHMAESSDQVEWHNLLTSRTIQAHCTFLSAHAAPSNTNHSNSLVQPPESNQFSHLHTLGTSIAHCPLSNIYFSPTHAFSLREALEAKVKVGLGTDIAGGYNLDIMNAMRNAVAVSRVREGQREKERILWKAEPGSELRSEPSGAEAHFESPPPGKSLAIDWKESLFLATVGGAQALGIESGMFRVGALFDAQQIKLFDKDTGVGVGALNFFELEMEMEKQVGEISERDRMSVMSEEMIEQWWCIGDQKNRTQMWVQGIKCLE
ncbi:hypothetical protein D9757_010350 [Collybiopsis confluens]|uniref:Amidohydrolase-related domain-containing protein n=1 Tax=Collybiopsis confluens TaxID=2823264 RepID=A0A8H5GMG5_9AGAR|nr:hypothetical protein D9757_010350 [Collybiopsis confluens]